MSTSDTRCLSSAAQEVLRFRVVRAIRCGMKEAEAAQTFGVSRTSIHRWLRRVAPGNIDALRSKPRGRPKGICLAPQNAGTVVRLITSRCPDQLMLPFALWTREAVRQLLAERFGLEVSLWTVGRYLAKWSMTPQKPFGRTYERDQIAVQRWLQEEYPGIRKQSKRQGGEIHWGDQMSLRCDHETGTSHGLRGCTPVIPGAVQRSRCNMLFTVTNRGRLAFMVFEGPFTVAVCIRFLQRMARHVGRKVFLVLDRHPVHRSVEVKRWLDAHAKEIMLFFLPDYDPDLNIDEFLYQDVNSNSLRRCPPVHQTEMIGTTCDPFTAVRNVNPMSSRTAATQNLSVTLPDREV